MNALPFQSRTAMALGASAVAAVLVVGPFMSAYMGTWYRFRVAPACLFFVLTIVHRAYLTRIYPGKN